ncbi:MAG: SDR family oxidoreductase [Thalassobaculales bacterium]
MIALSLAGKAIIVTGGAQGVGGGIAEAAARAGARGLCLHGRDRAKGEAAAAALTAAGCPAIFVAGDLGSEADCRALFAAAVARFGTLEGVVNAAGLTDRGSIEDTSVALWDRLFAVNARAPFILTQEFARHRAGQGGGGSVVNVITQSAHGGQPFLTAYAASKGALAVLTKNTANGLRRRRLRVNGIMLGWTDTPAEHVIQQRDGRPADWLERAEREQPFGRLIRPGDVATLAVYLLSDAAEMMTGALIDLDQNVVGTYD